MLSIYDRPESLCFCRSWGMRRLVACKTTFVVFHGRSPGFYGTLEECLAQVDGFHGSLYLVFNTREEAESAWMKYWAKASLRRWNHEAPDEAFSAYMSDAMGMSLKTNVWSTTLKFINEQNDSILAPDQFAPLIDTWVGLTEKYFVSMAIVVLFVILASLCCLK